MRSSTLSATSAVATRRACHAFARVSFGLPLPDDEDHAMGRRCAAVPPPIFSTEMATVNFEPIGEEVECEEDETVLDAAFRQGLSLVYGCREGQCSACKCFLLEGEVSLKRYSTFALSDAEEASG